MDLRCHRCSAFLGESHEPMELVGLFKAVADRRQVAEPRSTWRCKSCGWANVFRPMPTRARWRTVELKTGS